VQFVSEGRAAASKRVEILDLQGRVVRALGPASADTGARLAMGRP
jgi:hypothetical protein